MHSPGIPRLRKPFPPENDPRPPDGGSNADSRQFIHARKFPRFRDSRAWTAYAGERIAPLFPVTISCPGPARKREMPSERRKYNAEALFSEVVKFAGQISRPGSGKTAVRTDRTSRGRETRRRKNRTRDGSPDAAENPCFDRLASPPPDRERKRKSVFGSAHFGMRNSGTGICMP